MIDIIEELLQRLEHMVIEAKKSHNLPSGSWRTRKAGHVIQSQFEGLRRGTDDISPGLSLNAREPGAPMNKGRRGWMSQLKDKANLLFLCFFFFFFNSI